ncbi:acyl carrier protein [Nocardia aurea]|uniref:acyl carrier protein n=1 Tax=Nocardia aurea TaxID=2144174 RepID=UPI0033BD7241
MDEQTYAPAPELTAQLLRQLRLITGVEIGADDDYFEMGLVTPLRALEIVALLERTFDFEVNTDDLDPDNFRTVHRTAAFVVRKAAAPTRPAPAPLERFLAEHTHDSALPPAPHR